jgi:hypothetical protein
MCKTEQSLMPFNEETICQVTYEVLYKVQIIAKYSTHYINTYS